MLLIAVTCIANIFHSVEPHDVVTLVPAGLFLMGDVKNME